MKRPWKPEELGRDHAQGWGTLTRGGSTTPPTVLVETNDGAEASALWRSLGRHGYTMQWCPGPGSTPHRRCSLVTSGECGLVAHADVVISHLDLTREDSRETVVALGEVKPRNRVLVAAPGFVQARFPEVAERGTVIPDHLTGARVAHVVSEALRSDGSH